MHPHLCTDQNKLLRFQREAQSCSSLNHPNIAVIYDSGLLWAGRPYISMELIEGKSLAEIIANGKEPDIEQTLNYFTQICDGLEAIHAAGLLHRDLKPGNIKVSANGTVKILDFGCAKWVLQEQNLITRTDEAIGTPAYMSPEQCMGKPLDSRSDIYSFGCVMYEVLTGHRPFASDNLLECMKLHLKSMPPDFDSVQPKWQISKGLESVVFKALAKDPEDRYTSVKDLRLALSNCEVTPSPLFESWQRLGAKRRKQLLAMTTISIALILVGTAAWLEASRSRTISFPSGHAVGTIYTVIRDKNGVSKESNLIGPAQGEVKVPLNAYVQLKEIHAGEAKTLTIFQRFKGDEIQNLDLYGTSPSTEAVANINRLTKLDTLSLNSAKVNDEALRKLHLNELTGLDLTNVYVSDQSLISIAKNCQKLHWLQLKGNTAITDQGIEAVTDLPAIKGLLLQDISGIDDECLKSIGKSTTIDFLVLTADNISDAGIANLLPANSLTRLTLTATKITDESIKLLGRLPNLRHLNVSETRIDDGCIPALSALSQLRSLNISSTSISKEGVNRLRKTLSKCEIESSE